MIVILAPARNAQPLPYGAAGTPIFINEARRLAGYLGGLSPWQLESLLDVRPERALQLHAVYNGFGDAPTGPALLAYAGEVYRQLQPGGFTKAQMDFARRRLRILSALYGLLRPLDGIAAYRLNMKRQLRPYGQSMYDFWGDKPCRLLFGEGEVVVNLASGEYSKMITPHMRRGESMINCHFMVDRQGCPRRTLPAVRTIRGKMARYIVQHRIDRPDGLKDFSEDGFVFAHAASGNADFVFVKGVG